MIACEMSAGCLGRFPQLAHPRGLTRLFIPLVGQCFSPRLAAFGSEPDSVDAVLIVHTYHEMREHGAMLAHIRKALRPKGRLVIVEQIIEARRDAPRDVQVKAHDLAPEYVVTELHAAGFRKERLDANFTTNPATKDINWIIVATGNATGRPVARVDGGGALNRAEPAVAADGFAPEGEHWRYELNLDGFRPIAFKRDGSSHLRSRNAPST